MKISLTILLLVLVARLSAQIPPTPTGTVQEGVYFLSGMFQTTIVELKDGKFRFWFSSDAGVGGDVTKFPHTGKYATNGGTITFITTNSYVWPGLAVDKPHTNYLVQTNQWTFMNHQGRTTLWRPHALNYWAEKKELDSYGILFPTTKKAEEIWPGN